MALIDAAPYDGVFVNRSKIRGFAKYFGIFVDFFYPVEQTSG